MFIRIPFSWTILMRKLICIIPLILTMVVVASSLAEEDGPHLWVSLAEGLDFGRFPAGQTGMDGDSTVSVLRADPAHWSLDLFCASEDINGNNQTAQEWCEQNGLVAAINGGMFDIDYRTHVGYCAARGHINNGTKNNYQSVAASCPNNEGIPLFRIFDLDAPGVSLERISQDYECLAQNLRLIKRPAEGRWSQQPKRWSEAALGEDSQGRILFIFCRTAYSMHDLNEILLSLPLDLACAQHLEGGPEAQMYINAGDFEADYVGSYETDFFENDTNEFVTPIPVVFGLRAK